MPEPRIVRIRNKKTGKVSVYESVSHYDPEKKASRPIRKYLGQEDPVTGELVPTSGRRGRRPKSATTPATTATDATVPVAPVTAADHDHDRDRVAELEAKVAELEAVVASQRRKLALIADALASEPDESI